MPKFSVILNNKVVNLISAESKEDAELATQMQCIEFNDSFPYGPGSEFDGSEWKKPNQHILDESNIGEVNA